MCVFVCISVMHEAQYEIVHLGMMYATIIGNFKFM